MFHAGEHLTKIGLKRPLVCYTGKSLKTKIGFKRMLVYEARTFLRKVRFKRMLIYHVGKCVRHMRFIRILVYRDRRKIKEKWPKSRLIILRNVSGKLVLKEM